MVAVSVGALGPLPKPLIADDKSAVGPNPEEKASGFLCGILKTQAQYMLKDTRVGTPLDIPVTFFLIKHVNDWVAFDTGNNSMAKDPVAFSGEAFTKAYYPITKDYEEFPAQIEKLGLEPKKLKAVILSHGHLDHAGAIDNFKGTDVPIYMRKKELNLIEKAVASGQKTTSIPQEFKVMKELNIRTLDGVFDVFGDQTVVAIPTPGRTDDHQSLLVKPSGGGASWFSPRTLCTLSRTCRKPFQLA